MRTKFQSKAKMFNSGVVILAALAAALCAPEPKKLYPQPDGRIVGGSDANIEDFPYQLSLLANGGHICGASIIGKKWAVTAAHCTDRVPESVFTVRTGSSLLEIGGRLIKIKKIHQHPGFGDIDMDFDISILELAEDIHYGNGTAPIELVSANAKAVPGAIATVTGWGVLEQDLPILPSHLQVVKVPIVSNGDCEKVYGENMITDRMLCAGYQEGGKDSCQGDSGGPFVVDGKLAGIVSWGYGCAEPGTPGVYTNVAALRDFVTDIAKI